MNKNLLTIVAGLALATPFTTNAQITRSALPDTQGNHGIVAQEHSLPIPAGFNRQVRNVNAENQPGNYLSQLERIATSPATRARKSKEKAPALRANVQATSLNGYMSWVGASGERGWYNVSWPYPTLQWNAQSTGVSCTAGFVRDGELFAFYTQQTTESLTGAGLKRVNLSDGTVIQTTEYELFDSYAKVVTDAAYDPITDMAYVVTYNDAGNAFILQRFNPTDGSFTNLGLTFGNANSEDVPMAFTWSAADNAPYFITFNKDLKRYDSRNKRFVTAGTVDYDFGPYSGAMVYSPKDDAFIGLFTGYDFQDNEACDVVSIKSNGTVAYVSTMAYDCQWSLLSTTDSYVAPNAPAEVKIETVNVDGPATSGTIDVKLPSVSGNGTAITGRVYLQVKVDGTTMAGNAVSGTPGSVVSIKVNLEEGLHKIAITPYVLSDDGIVYGTPTFLRRYFGYDTPAMPTNVALTDTRVSWNAVTDGENNGYIDASTVTYNVFVDGTLMNTSPISETSLDITLPATGTVSHRAAVVAIANGRTSEEGLSAPLYATGTLAVPVYLGPEKGENDLAEEVRGMFTIVKDPANTNSARHWQYDQQDPFTGGFYCLCPYESSLGNKSDEWLFLPAINFDDAESFYRLEMEVWAGNHYYSSDETYEVALCKRPNGSNPTIIREASTIHKSTDFSISETIFKVPSAGTYYIGIHYISPIADSFRLYARKFRVEKSQATDKAPAEVTGLRATAAERGELTANVTFTMPTLSVSGNPLDAATNIDATIETSIGRTTTTGKPGAKMQAQVAAIQGENTVKVTTSSDDGTGKLAETTVYCGVYRPGSVDLDYAVSADGNTITLNWSLDEYNDNDEFVGPDQCTYTVYRRLGDEWRAAAQVGHDLSWTFTTPTPATQDIYSFAVAATNAAGTSEIMTTVGTILGTPYSLPFHETFPYSGETVDMKDPVLIESLSYLPALWSFTDPAEVDAACANASGIAFCAMGESLTQATLPKFSTKGMSNVKFELSLYFGDRTPSQISVLASTPDVSFVPVASFTPSDGNGWVNKLINLPASCQNQGWVSLTIRANIVGYSQVLLIDGYALSDYPAEMMTIDTFSGPTRSVVGETSSFSVKVANAGSAATPAPAYTMQVLTDAGAVDLTCALPSEAVAPSGTVDYTFTYTPTSAHIGNAVVRFTLPGQPDGAVKEVEHNLTVLNAQLPVVNDLAGTIHENDVTLTWTIPGHVETFEAFEPWDYSDEMRGFLNIDRDGNNVYSIAEVSYPGKFAPKAYQVFTSASTDNPLFAAHSGEHYLLALSSNGAQATDNWLISPEVKGGTEVSFWMNLLSDEYPETLLVMWSDGSTDTNDFKEVDGGYICPAETGWKQYSVTLPANAKRFALWHAGDEGDDLFGFMIDDLAFEPLTSTVQTSGYNVYRNGQLVASDLTMPGYTDRNVDLSMPVQYVVKTVGLVGNEKVESNRSNVIWIDTTSGIDEIGGSESARMIAGGIGQIVLTGFAEGKTVRVFNAAGATVAATTTTHATTTIKLMPGIYIVDCDSLQTKVTVR